MTLHVEIVFLALLGLSTALVCPDGSMCEDRSTCCKNTVGGYGCCPLPNAECCSDHLHCCYEGTICDLVHDRCINQTVSLPWVRRIPAKPSQLIPRSKETVKAVLCPDGESECPDETTCCQLQDGSWGCCAYAEAICCEDKIHCCPGGTICDVEHSRCLSASLQSFPMLKKLPSRRGNSSSSTVTSVTCPGGETSCPDDYTCCLLKSRQYGCCPLPEAVCCNDFIHCCPAKTICDPEHGVCKTGEMLLPLLKKVSATPENIICPDKTTPCPDQSTCCLVSQSQYGCCPMLDAVCCSDFIHCCPAGTKCDLRSGQCVSSQEEANRAVKIPAAAATEMVAAQRVSSVRCNDSAVCADGTTCCELYDGTWGCCPLPQAVCCSDRFHCCPHGTVCNMTSETCDEPSGLLPSLQWVAKVSAVTSEAQNEKCDEQTMCQQGTTCCRKESGLWACCPLPQAVCCNDHEHCCPDGYKCNVAEQTCDKPGALSTPWLQQLPALSVLPGPIAASAVKCDDKTSCPSGTTCCKMQAGQWGCCPLDKAVCCADHAHCCPQGYTCNMQSGTCEKKRHNVPIHTLLQSKVVPSQAVDSEGDAYAPCDSAGEFYCPKQDTCCKISGLAWACCPSPRAVCCSDLKRCCPAGHTCDPQSGGCTLQSPSTWDTFFRRQKERL